MYTFPPLTVNGLPPRPTLTVVSPIRLSEPQLPAFACASSHNGNPARLPASPGGMCNWIAFRFWLPSSRLIVVENGVNAPAWTLVEPACNEGANGNELAHSAPFGPETIWKTEAELTDGLPDHGAINASAV